MMAEQTLFEQLAETLGKDAALNLCEQYGGRTIYIGKNLLQSADLKAHWESRFGEKATEGLVERFGGKHVYIPAAPQALLDERNQLICGRLRLGESAMAIAHDYRLTDRHVRGIFSVNSSQGV